MSIVGIEPLDNCYCKILILIIEYNEYVQWNSLTCIRILVKNVVIARIVNWANILEYWWWGTAEWSKCWLKQ